MDKNYKILVINPGSTSTKIALFNNEEEIFNTNISHEPEEMKCFKEVQEQLPYRRDMVERELALKGTEISDIDIFVGRGGGLVPIAGGTYEVTAKLAEHASKGMSGQHPAQLASQICKQFADRYGKHAFVVNPPDVDEFDLIARISGVKGLYRESRIHALNQKEVALRYCAAKERKYNEINLIICHIGGGISVTAHRKGKMVDSNDIMNGDGPMAPTRAGSLPYLKVIKMAYSGEYTEKELVSKLNKEGGLTDHLGTADAKEVEKRIIDGDKYAETVYNAMIYQIAKSVGSCACVLKGNVDAILLTGGISHSKYLVDTLKEYIGWISPIEVMAGEFEMEALAAGALRVMRGEEEAVVYTGQPLSLPACFS
ncbi:butyrate kinase [Dehalobacter sp. DCM]|uniref:butyrate kinase n=1 Tax=Dehalobacter sp. DCM TaxID=2907827 RepID=UPI0030817409|nr:butyrate kinase [Dehalobacter sp. DCM]